MKEIWVTDKSPREFWISLDFCNVSDEEQPHSIHVIEYSAFEKIQRELRIERDEICQICYSELKRHYPNNERVFELHCSNKECGHTLLPLSQELLMSDDHITKLNSENTKLAAKVKELRDGQLSLLKHIENNKRIIAQKFEEDGELIELQETNAALTSKLKMAKELLEDILDEKYRYYEQINNDGTRTPSYHTVTEKLLKEIGE